MSASTEVPPGHEEVVVLDFGSQFNQLIARRVREQNVYCRIVTPQVTAEELRARRPKGIILSGGPASVYDEGAPQLDPAILDLGIPILGICYGMQVFMHLLDSPVEPAQDREFGHRDLEVTDPGDLFAETPSRQVVWMSHGDQVTDPGGQFKVLAKTGSCPNAAVVHSDDDPFAKLFVNDLFAGRVVGFGSCRCWCWSCYICYSSTYTPKRNTTECQFCLCTCRI